MQFFTMRESILKIIHTSYAFKSDALFQYLSGGKNCAAAVNAEAALNTDTYPEKQYLINCFKYNIINP
ncbi:MAG: hypothetical protein GY739_22030 [Mesoflavibacter sp.]|nr:hypothetical protein [Mesoflavibacter sp.]